MSEDMFDAAESIEEAINLAIGAASMCWEDVRAAGEFDSSRAKEIGEALYAHIQERWSVGAEVTRLRAEVAWLRSAGDGAADVGYVIGYRRKLPGLDWEGDWYQTRERADQELSRCQNEGYVFAVFEVRKAVDR